MWVRERVDDVEWERRNEAWNRMPVRVARRVARERDTAEARRVAAAEAAQFATFAAQMGVTLDD